jgi:hypothetical protein
MKKTGAKKLKMIAFLMLISINPVKKFQVVSLSFRMTLPVSEKLALTSKPRPNLTSI